MTAQLLQRQAALAAIALLAVMLAVALAAFADRSAAEDGRPGSAAAGEEDVDWYTALAAPYRFEPDADRTACGQPAGPETLGVAHPVLPCGAKVVLSYAGTEVLTQVVDRGPGVPGREFDVTAPLAERLGLRGAQTIRWRFAQ